MSQNVQVIDSFYNIDPDQKQRIRELIQKNIDQKMSAYLQKLKGKGDSEVRLTYKLDRNKKNKYEAKFFLNVDGIQYIYSSKVPFKYEEDLVNHAFDHFKLAMSSR